MPSVEQPHSHLIRLHGVLIALALLLTLAGCTTVQTSCQGSLPYGLMDADAVNQDTRLPFRFPLDASMEDEDFQSGWFAISNADVRNTSETGIRYHAGEDYRRSPGTPVYATADGIIRYSGPTFQHGWLIAIDHPDANLYSLYAHLAISGWHTEPGEVMRGDLIGYVGDPAEFTDRSIGSSDSYLHFAIRTGQWGNYPGLGPWRTEGFWVKRCPQDLGWLHPSITITLQTIPSGGFPDPEAGFFTRWWPDILLTGLILLAALGMILLFRKWKRPLLMLLPAILLFLSGSLLYATGSALSHVLIMATVIVITIGVQMFINRHRERKGRSGGGAAA